MLVACAPVSAVHLSGHVGVEARSFYQDSHNSESVNDNLTLSTQPKWQWGPARFPAVDARLGPPLPVWESLARYESDDEERHLDGARRYSVSIGDHEIGLSVFRGTQREPELQPGTVDGTPVLIPYYPLMTQWGLDVQSIMGNWTWKLQAIHRKQDDKALDAATAGFVYSFYGLLGSALDLACVWCSTMCRAANCWPACSTTAGVTAAACASRAAADWVTTGS